MAKQILKVKGMHCASCSTLIDKLIGKEEGVTAIKTNYGAEKTAIEYDEKRISLERIDELMNKIGYDLIRPDETGGTRPEDEEKSELRKIEEAKRRVIAAFVLALPIIVYYMLIHMFNVTHVHEFFDFINRQIPALSGSGFFAYGSYLTNYFFWLVAQPVKLLVEFL
jgi:cation transport ATPase